MDNQADDQHEEEGGGFSWALARSYLAFGLHSVRKRRLLSALIFTLTAGLVSGLLAVWPRTYHCETKLMVGDAAALELGNNMIGVMQGASNAITRFENVAEIVKRAKLAQNWESTRPPLQGLKDRLMWKLRGSKPSEEVLNEALTGWVQSTIGVYALEGTIAIWVDWSDPVSGSDLVNVAGQMFIESRHHAEISTIQEKIAILDGHSHRLREEIDSIATEVKKAREDRVADAGKSVQPSEAPAPAPVVVRRAAPAASAPLPDHELPRLKEELGEKKRRLGELENESGRRLSDAQSRLAELKLKYTEAHPEVLAAKRAVDVAAVEAPRLLAARSELATLEAEIAQRELPARVPTPKSAGGTGAVVAAPQAPPPAADVLPAEVMKLLESDKTDPVVSAQLASAVARYGALRDSIRTARIDLDTQQAAFNYRYKVVVPSVPPGKPIKPNVPPLLAAGLIGSLLLALLIPILLELRSGVIVEIWQVHTLKLPVLAELKLPPGPGSS